MKRQDRRIEEKAVARSPKHIPKILSCLFYTLVGVGRFLSLVEEHWGGAGELQHSPFSDKSLGLSFFICKTGTAIPTYCREVMEGIP